MFVNVLSKILSFTYHFQGYSQYIRERYMRRNRTPEKRETLLTEVRSDLEVERSGR